MLCYLLWDMDKPPLVKPFGSKLVGLRFSRVSIDYTELCGYRKEYGDARLLQYLDMLHKHIRPGEEK